MSDERAMRRALVIESDPFASERLRYMLRAEEFSVCAVDEWPLFRTLAAQHVFDLFVASDALAQRGEALEVLRKLEPLLVLGGADAAGITRLRMALPAARLLERALRDPDALRRALGALETAHPELGAPAGPGSTARGPAAQQAGAGGPLAREWLSSAFGSFALSERQLEVLGRALCGETSREIAARLYISEPTVRNHLHAIYERIGVSGRRELLGCFVRGLVDPGASAGPRAAGRSARSAR